MKKIKTEYRPLYALAAAVLMFAALAHNFDSPKEEKKNLNSDFISLPKLALIDEAKTPLIYDFVNGSLGYKYKENNFIDFGIYYTIAQNKNNKGAIFVSYYDYPEKIVFPILGTEPIKETEFDKEIFNKAIKSIDKNRVFSEGDWNFYVISLYKKSESESIYNSCDPSGNWSGIKLEKYNGNSGPMYIKIFNEGLGWPSEWIRNSPFKETVTDYGINIEDSFFDYYNIYSTHKYKNENGEELNVTVVQLDRFQFPWNGQTQELAKIEQLNQFLQENGYK